jgi:CO/xanthine dehydrogenase Mo-binding subunit
MADLAGSDGERKEFYVVGKPNLPGKLSYSIATGRSKYGIDFVVPDMLHAKFLRSPYANAAVKSADISKAKTLPGVVDIITWEDPDIQSLGRRGGGMMGGGEGGAARKSSPQGAGGGAGTTASTHLVICAIANAIGKWIDPPATPDKVLKALGKA